MVSRVVQDWPKVSIQNTDYVLACDNKQSSSAWALKTNFMAIVSAILFVYALWNQKYIQIDNTFQDQCFS